MLAVPVLHAHVQKEHARNSAVPKERHHAKFLAERICSTSTLTCHCCECCVCKGSLVVALAAAVCAAVRAAANLASVAVCIKLMIR
jgi:hypothetical protein